MVFEAKKHLCSVNIVCVGMHVHTYMCVYLNCRFLFSTVGQCFDGHTESPTPGLEYVMGTRREPDLYDTTVMANLVRACMVHVCAIYS